MKLGQSILWGLLANYALFINALAGIHDDAGIDNHSMAGTKLLWEAMEVFRSEFRARFPFEEPGEKPE